MEGAAYKTAPIQIRNDNPDKGTETHFSAFNPCFS